MEEKKDDIIYDLESAEAAEEQSTQRESEPGESHAGNAEEVGAQGESDDSESSDISENSDSSGNSENSDSSENSENSDCSEPSDPHELELRRMVEEMGAETLLEIIRDNRNAAIRQIISEVEASRGRHMPSGGSAAPSCTSIFDLAALA